MSMERMGGSQKLTPEQLEMQKSRALSDAELLRGDAEYVNTEGSTMLQATPEQIESARMEMEADLKERENAERKKEFEELFSLIEKDYPEVVMGLRGLIESLLGNTSSKTETTPTKAVESDAVATKIAGLETKTKEGSGESKEKIEEEIAYIELHLADGPYATYDTKEFFDRYPTFKADFLNSPNEITGNLGYRKRVEDWLKKRLAELKAKLESSTEKAPAEAEKKASTGPETPVAVEKPREEEEKPVATTSGTSAMGAKPDTGAERPVTASPETPPVVKSDGVRAETTTPTPETPAPKEPSPEEIKKEIDYLEKAKSEVSYTSDEFFNRYPDLRKEVIKNWFGNNKKTVALSWIDARLNELKRPKGSGGSPETK